MAKDPGKEFIATDQRRKMSYFSALEKTVFQITCHVLSRTFKPCVLDLRVRDHRREVMSLPKTAAKSLRFLLPFLTVSKP